MRNRISLSVLILGITACQSFKDAPTAPLKSANGLEVATNIQHANESSEKVLDELVATFSARDRAKARKFFRSAMDEGKTIIAPKNPKLNAMLVRMHAANNREKGWK